MEARLTPLSHLTEIGLGTQNPAVPIIRQDTIFAKPRKRTAFSTAPSIHAIFEWNSSLIISLLQCRTRWIGRHWVATNGHSSTRPRITTISTTSRITHNTRSPSQQVVATSYRSPSNSVATPQAGVDWLSKLNSTARPSANLAQQSLVMPRICMDPSLVWSQRMLEKLSLVQRLVVAQTLPPLRTAECRLQELLSYFDSSRNAIPQRA